MADPYIPFGFMPPRFQAPPELFAGTPGGMAAPGNLPPLQGPPPRSLAQMGFTPPPIPLAMGGAMPNPAERADIRESANAAAGLADVGSLFVGGPVFRAAERGAGLLAGLASRYPAISIPAAGTAALTVAPGQAETPDPPQETRAQIAKLRKNQEKLTAERDRLTANSQRFEALNDPELTPEQRKAAIQKAQEFLQTQGLYLRDDKGRAVKPDGVWGTGMTTAVQQYQQQLRQKQADNKAAFDSLDKDLQAQQQRLTGLEGGERLREAEKNVGPFSRMLRDYGEIGGTAAGLALGGLGRWGMVRHANRAAAEGASEIEQMLERRMTAVPPRTGRLNEVWRQGGAPPEGVPFSPAPGTRYGVATNPAATPSSELFRGPTGIRGQFTGTDMAVMGGAGGDIAISEVRRRAAENELAQAQQDAKADPSELNIGRMQRAMDEVAFWQSMSRLGQTFGAGYALTATKTPRLYPQPNLSQAEMANLNRLINPPRPPPRKRGR
jgi:hypothetical protein